MQKKGNLREQLNIEELIVLDNIQAFNSYLLAQGLSAEERLIKIQEEARRQFSALKNSRTNLNTKSDNK